MCANSGDPDKTYVFLHLYEHLSLLYFVYWKSDCSNGTTKKASLVWTFIGPFYEKYLTIFMGTNKLMWNIEFDLNLRYDSSQEYLNKYLKKTSN